MISPGPAGAAIQHERVSPGLHELPDPADFEEVEGLEVVRVTLPRLPGRR
jgi:hypothetical protein